ncbi:60S ribosomal protein L36, putative [Entamoeba invadens IP1]|uniref:60S ribosomal protein L36, putative n=1 Tax=Entamoeba invadens IP1 TaxID=370355 RepID=UPI0002C3F980|nr:60S ribosomal protein L36, putative [Entamoeba invadens IP1]ELP94255.1 60S ribosomal protein L36, putative [Entamoeba invadens IP1]|eukprot:XP_004261026.1 60S ribosomal protein L36, putative [Entamoeba invadens IP1]
MGRGVAVGLKKGFPVHRLSKPREISRPISKTKMLVEDVTREAAGFSPYERHMMDLLRRGLDKKALKYAKKQLGTHKRGLAKREELSRVLEAMRVAHAHHTEAAK